MKRLSYDKVEISKRLKISHPFLMIDRIDSLIPGESATGYKRIGPEDWFFECHLPLERVMPGSLLTEIMLQTLVLVVYSIEGHQDKPAFVTEMRTRLFSKVGPGADLIVQANLSYHARGISKGKANVFRGAVKICEGEFCYMSPHATPHPRMARAETS